MDENKDLNRAPSDPSDRSGDDIDEVIKIFHKNSSDTAPHSYSSISFSAEAPSNTSSQKPSASVPKRPAPSAEPTKVDMDAIHTGSQTAKLPDRKTPSAESTVHRAPSSEARRLSGSAATPAASTVSLDDFNRGAAEPHKKKKEDPSDKVSFLGSASFGVVKVVGYFAFVAICCFLLVTTAVDIGNDVFAFVKKDADGNSVAALREDMNVTVVLPENATTADVAEILKDAGVIEHPWVFELFAKFRISKRSYLTGEYLTGEVTVNPMMNYDTLINTLSSYVRSQRGTVRITIPEGSTVEETLDLLVKNGVGRKEDFLEALQEQVYDYKFCEPLTRENLSEYRFDTSYSYRLEGYLFPDTYDFYLGENPVSAIGKFLTNFNRKFEAELYERCDELGMTVDEVITLASIIEKEGNNPSDYYIISSVFHNRLNHAESFPYLNSDATLQYAQAERSGPYGLDTTLDNPYNTYKYKGLPPGPICNPGIEAIYAALYPDSTSYYYFYTKRNGETVYSKTFEEHQNKVNADKASASDAN